MLGTRILVVDDQKTFRELNCSALRQGGYTDIVCASDGEEALRLLKGQRFSMMVTDLEMPRLTGLELVRAMQDDASIPRVPVVLLTSVADAQFVMEARKLNVSGYLLKPVSPANLMATVKRVLTH